MISVVEKLLSKGYAYQAGDNIYFDVNKFSDYGKLSGNTGVDLLEGVRVEADPLKHDPRDFTLWKAAEAGREMQWDSPWGSGFPGWHIECSAMAAKYLGEQFDIHTGGVDNIFPHHEDEIAQSEAAFGQRHVRYWVHGQHLLADGAKMAKSAGNVFLLDDMVSRGFCPLAFRYLCMTVRYRHRMNFTFNSLKASERALTNLRHRIWVWKNLPELTTLPSETEQWRRKFWETVENDLDLPGALALTWDMVSSDLPGQAKLALLLDYVRVFGLDLDGTPTSFPVPYSIQNTINERRTLRSQAEYLTADDRRATVLAHGYLVEDTREGTRVRPKTPLEQQEERWKSVSSSREVDSLLDQPNKYDFTFLLNAYNYVSDVERCVNSMLKYSSGYSAEIIVVDNGSTDGTAEWLERLQLSYTNARVIHCDHVLGDAAAKNIGLKQSLGRNIIIVDGSLEIIGDVLGPIGQQLADETVGIFGPYGLTTHDLRHFHEEVDKGEADAIQAYCMAFRREAVKTVGFMRESFRFYRNLDIDYGFQFKDKGYRIVADNSLPVIRHEHRQWTELDDNQRDELSRKNFGRFLKRWGNRPELLIAAGATGMGIGFFHH
jgi:cysteinyl-tRNA synthetase